jgi:hypothetical protein
MWAALSDRVHAHHYEDQRQEAQGDPHRQVEYIFSFKFKPQRPILSFLVILGKISGMSKWPPIFWIQSEAWHFEILCIVSVIHIRL